MTSYTGTIFRQVITFCLAGLFALSSVPVDAEQQSTPAEQSQPGNSQNGGAQTNNNNSLPDAPTASQSGATQSSTTAKPQNSNQSQQPVGTAAAGIENTAGVAASKPAGVAMAPPKQRRVRMMVIKVGAIVGAGAALGTVVGLTKGSPSHPPGAH